MENTCCYCKKQFKPSELLMFQEARLIEFDDDWPLIEEYTLYYTKTKFKCLNCSFSLAEAFVPIKKIKGMRTKRMAEVSKTDVDCVSEFIDSFVQDNEEQQPAKQPRKIYPASGRKKINK